MSTEVDNETLQDRKNTWFYRVIKRSKTANLPVYGNRSIIEMKKIRLSGTLPKITKNLEYVKTQVKLIKRIAECLILLLVKKT